MTIRVFVESGNYFADNSNHGDRAIFLSIAAKLRATWPGCEICWVTGEGGVGAPQRDGVTPILASDAAGRSRALSNSDLVLATGGGYFTDSFASHARAVLETLEAGLQLGKPTAILSCGFEPISDRSLASKMLEVLPKIGLVACREPAQSRDVLLSMGVHMNRLLIAGDEALEFAFCKRPAKLASGLGINIRCAEYAGVGLGTIADLGKMLHAAVADIHAPLVPIPISVSGPSDIDAIRELIGDLADRVDDRRGVDDPAEIVARAGDCRIVVTGSYHAAVFALAQGVSVVAMVASPHYRSKFRGLQAGFSGIGLRIVELGRAETKDVLTEAVSEAWREAPTVRGALLRATEQQIAKCHRVYQRLHDLVGPADAIAEPAAEWDIQLNSATLFPAATAKPSETPRKMQRAHLPSLSEEEIETFRRQGYLGPFTAFSPDYMQQVRQTILERVLTTPSRYCPFGLRVRHLDSRTVSDLCSSPEILGRMASIYGPDLVLWNSNLFNKPPAEPSHLEEYPWHQDHYNWNMEPVLNISAWLAIGPATEENGCVQVIPGSHRQIIPPVTDTNPDLSLRFGGIASDPRYVDEAKKVSLPLKSGQFFLFTERLLHHSNPNRTTENRLGLAIRVTVPIVKVSEPFPCVLVAGEDRMGFNRYASPPSDEPDADWLASLPLEHVFEFDRPIPGMGWHLLENDGTTKFAWTGLEPTAWLDFRPAEPGDYVVRWEVVHAISPAAIQEAVLHANSVALETERRQEGSAVVLEARLPARVLRLRSDRLRLHLEGCKPLRPCDVDPASPDKRSLGLGIRRVSVSAVGAGE
ncbi:phytanoyl-CoA dioxygenase family protein [Bradyrhizobium sp. 199]|uniref:phytanoyl-CoA dioxygenase family protein n=1 Tax=Bradyrhizobium sp. 199 TaxID=2782664 RepID=UPI001FFAE901|nr:phytanoyl-CoA dioxygenase family protein [Bradyrhizobium sp. 199]MCK1362198.1 polysaccharide pyruvyl transferase family protein [Bradyrhizobium sp. 199]